RGSISSTLTQKRKSKACVLTNDKNLDEIEIHSGICAIHAWAKTLTFQTDQSCGIHYIISDNKSQFTSQVLMEFCSENEAHSTRGYLSKTIKFNKRLFSHIL
ncbi:hypothetical protein ACJX0J_016760, partial [Zea mays]